MPSKNVQTTGGPALLGQRPAKRSPGAASVRKNLGPPTLKGGIGPYIPKAQAKPNMQQNYLQGPYAGARPGIGSSVSMRPRKPMRQQHGLKRVAK